jgi:peptidoglycan/xylan/chitin deacetylase (PgdA/CDA1 family)
MWQPSSDDGTMTSIVVKDNRVTLTPGTSSYFYSQFDCISATNKYGGISLRIKAASGTTLSVELQTSVDCTTDNPVSNDLTSTELGWTFDGTEKLYSIPFSKFSELDTGNMVAVLFSSLTNPVTLGPMAFYCGDTVSEYILPSTTTTAGPTSTVPATTATATPFLVDAFSNADSNALGFWHGGDDDSGISISGGKLTINFTDSDYSYYTQLTSSCRDMSTYDTAYIHIAFTGSSKFSIALQQHNSACNDSIAPYPETWDEVYAERYASGGHIYVPISQFDVTKTRIIGIALKGFAVDAGATVFSRIEIVSTVPTTYKIPSKLATAPLIFACTRPNSFAFAIDDGSPDLAQQVLSIVKAADIKVTFFTVGAALLDASTNLTNVYKEMLAAGHQVALHSYTHPKMEGLPSVADIDWEIDNDIVAVEQTLGISSKYFRPPFGNEGARFRERIAAKIPGGKLINWSVDVQDWLWGTSDTPEKQLESFAADVAKGGNLVVMHYLYESTVEYLPQFIAQAKATGKQLMRVDQCLEDPDAPAL